MDWDFSTTLIGSLPSRDAVSAVDVVVTAGLDCPAWPQLPKLGYGESMYVQTGSKFPGIVVGEDSLTVDLSDYDPTSAYEAIIMEDREHFSLDPKHAAGFAEFMGRDFPGARAVKGQVTGIISEGLVIQDGGGRAAIYDAAYCEIMRKGINLAAKWQADALSSKSDTVIIFFDEPSLSLLGSPFASISTEQAVAWMNETMEGLDCVKAVHCCGNTDWPMVMSTDIDVLSFDALEYGRSITLFAEDVSDFVDRGGALAWGIVPSTDEAMEGVTVASLCDKLEGLFDALESKGMDREKVARKSMITPQCGLGGMDESSLAGALGLLRDTSLEMKGRYGL
ncbi:MAG: hypothetical protein GX224_01805 [Thermoplasmatales archaeon]|nr:hypothetical protein [Thermoplasmatales archaeon]